MSDRERQSTSRPSDYQKGGLFKEINELRDGKFKIPNEEPEEKSKYDNSPCGRLAGNQHFEYVTLSVIVGNALYLGYDCDYNARWGKPDDLYADVGKYWGFIVMDNFFCAFFTFEVVVRFIGYEIKKNSCTDVSFLFDLALVVLMIIETWILAFLGPIDALKQVSILRLLRLARLLRMGKLLRMLPALMLIVKGMIASVRSVGCACILLMLCVYVFSIIFTGVYHAGHKIADDEELTDAEALFGDLGRSMRHLLIMGTILDDLTACTNAIRQSEKTHMLMVFWVCVILSALTLFNMMVGILCEVISATSAAEERKTEDKKLNDLIMGFFTTMDKDGSGAVSVEEFLMMRKDPSIMDSLSKLNIESKHFDFYAELLFQPKNDGDPPPEVTYIDVVDMIMRMRPGEKQNGCDFNYFKMIMLKKNTEIMEHLNMVETILDEINGTSEENGDGEGVAHPAHNGRPLQSIANLAESPVAAVALAPPIASRWNPNGVGAPAVPHSSPAPLGTKIDEAVTEHLHHLMQMREDMSNELWGSRQLRQAGEDDQRPPLLD